MANPRKIATAPRGDHPDNVPGDRRCVRDEDLGTSMDNNESIKIEDERGTSLSPCNSLGRPENIIVGPDSLNFLSASLPAHETKD